jgi:hypothetical protein
MKPIPVSIEVSEPWEIGEPTIRLPISGEVLRVGAWRNRDSALVKLGAPIKHRDVVYEFAVATPRREGQRVDQIVAGTTISASFVGISAEQAESADPFDTSGWRGGLAFIGDIQRAR